jgi:transcriptional antiterminator RfaH
MQGWRSGMQRWYLVHTKPFGEMSAQINLERQGYGIYFPRLLQTVRFAGRCREKIAALFPRYLFVRLEEGRQSLSPVRSTVGVAAVVCFGSQYAVVPEAVVRGLQARESESGLHRLSRATPYLRGSTVRITTGPFEGLEGVFEREAGSERVVVLLDLLGHRASVRLPTDIVLPALAV